MKEKIFKTLLYLCVSVFVLAIISFIIFLIDGAFLSLKKFGLKFFVTTDWDPVLGKYGGLSYITGTIVTSLLALLFSLIFSFSIIITLGEYLIKGTLAKVLNYIVDLITVIPSTIIGLWGLFTIVPLVRSTLEYFGISSSGLSVFSASILLSFMIVPYSATLGQHALKMVPQDIKEAAYSLGATRWEVIKKVMLPYARSGIFAGIMLSLGRALGETMAVTMVIGNSHHLLKSIFEPSNTIASVIANEFTEATDELYLSSLIYLALILLIITTVTNIIGNLILKKYKV
ncbi:MAG: phosphate ABC transporter permease subunit PstC [Bacteroidales bacterium]|nr:phosphate ABC transporter permease subunit PstC [Bacteroidales bacterium]